MSKLNSSCDSVKRKGYNKDNGLGKKITVAATNFEEVVLIKKERGLESTLLKSSESPLLPPISKKIQEDSEEPLIPKILGLYSLFIIFKLKVIITLKYVDSSCSIYIFYFKEENSVLNSLVHCYNILFPYTEKSKQAVQGKILIKDLKNSIVYNDTVKEIENKVKEKAARMEDGELSDSSTDNRTPTLSPSPVQYPLLRSPTLSPTLEKVENRVLSPTKGGITARNDLRLILREKEKKRLEGMDKRSDDIEKSKLYMDSEYKEKVYNYNQKSTISRDGKRNHNCQSQEKRRSESRTCSDSHRSRSRGRDKRRDRSRDRHDKSRSNDRRESVKSRERRRHRSRSDDRSRDKYARGRSRSRERKLVLLFY